MPRTVPAMLRAAAAAGALAIASASFAPALAQEPKMVGGAPMYADKNIVENAVNSQDHTTLVAAVQAADLVDTLSGEGPFTVFAPTNAAFAKLPAGTVENLVMPENKDTLTKVLTYHVVAGEHDAQDLVNRIAQGGGTATLKTVEGGTLTFTQPDSKRIAISDGSGNTARTTIFDVEQSNGVIHVIDTVLMPSM